jgi:DNA-binding transcriptional LysR family regulator
LQKPEARTQESNWDDLRFILALGRMPTFTAAARHLGVNESTVARRIARFETRMNTRLFERRMGMLQPTDACRELILRAERVEIEVQAVEGMLTGGHDRAAGNVRISAVPIVANHILVPALPKLLNQHRDLEIELITNGRDFNLTNGEADIAIRLARPTDDTPAIVKRVGQLTYATYSATAHANKSIPWITYSEDLEDLPQAGLISSEIEKSHNTRPQLRVNDAETLLQSVKKGLGKSMLPVHVGSRESGIIRIGDEAKTVTREVWLLVHPELQDTTRIRIVIDWLTTTIDQASHEY